MECLFDADKPHFATWIWIYDEDYEISMPSIRPGKPKAAPLYYAAMLGFRDLAKHLIAKHPEHINVRGGLKVTPMHVAATAGHVDVLSLLLEHGADVDVRNDINLTPLYWASRCRELEAGQFLLDRGADINARGIHGETPLSGALYEGRFEIARMLIERGARINFHNTETGNTPLHLAVEKGNIQAVRLLLEYGADVSARDRDGRSPSQLTREQEIVELLSKYGAESVEYDVESVDTT
jgi:ankyrin repeat protein